MYMFYLGGTLLPVAPPKLEMKISNKNKTLTLINEGEINVLKTPGLTEISFSCLLPGIKYPWARYGRTINTSDGSTVSEGLLLKYTGSGELSTGFKLPSYYLSVFEKLKVDCKPFEFVVIRTLDNGNTVDSDTTLTVSLEEYTITEDAEDGRDVTVDVKLMQYKAYGTKIVTIKENTATEETQRDSSSAVSTAVSTYTIVKGDTLWGIAKTKLGSGTKWTSIYDANKDVIESAAKAHGKSSSANGHWIYPGTVITIPS